MIDYEMDRYQEPDDDPRDDPEMTKWLIQQIIDALQDRNVCGYDYAVHDAYELLTEHDPLTKWLEWVEEQKV